MSDLLRPLLSQDVPVCCSANFGPVKCRLVRFHTGPHEGQLATQRAIVSAVWHEDGHISWRGEFLPLRQSLN